ncbi:MAG TPA: glycosyltransferase [Acidimicrobiales bacterium]|nr:glycosyltransferase [Acidimicrobiales bacterium]
MSPASPLTVTLITPTLDAAKFLPEMLESVRPQRLPDLEHIVIDGGSTDETLDLLSAEPEVTVVRQRSAGLYAALNEGMALAAGEVIGFVNADDLLAPGALRALVEGFERAPSAGMVSGGGVVFRDDGSGRQRVVNDRGVKRLREQDVTHGFPMLNARLYRRSLLERVGPFDTRWPRCPDHEFLLRVVDAQPVRGAVEQVVYRYRAHPDSLTFRGGIERDLIEEIVSMCTVRLEETTGQPRLHSRFRRWHTWGRTYLALRDASERDLRGVFDELRAGLRVDALLPFVASMQVAQHLRMRTQRR